MEEPTNIIYQNKFDDQTNRSIRKLVSFIILSLLIIAGFASIFLTQKVQSHLHREYPKVDCAAVTQHYTDQNALKTFALIEWFHL